MVNATLGRRPSLFEQPSLPLRIPILAGGALLLLSLAILGHKLEREDAPASIPVD